MSSRPRSRRSSPLWFFGGGVAIVALIGIIAIVATRGNDDEDGGEGAATIEVAASVQIDGSSLPGFEPDGEDRAVGARAPVVTGEDFDGTSVTIGEASTPQLVVFLAHWCPHCQAEVPRIIALREAGEIPPAVDVVAVATATDPDRDNYPPSEWLAREGWASPVLLDTDVGGEVATAYGLGSFPFFVSIDADGRVLARDSGELSEERLRELVGQAAASVDDPATIPTTAGP